MSLNLVYPNAATMRQIAQDLITNLTLDDVALKILPFEDENTHYVRWFQPDNGFGLMGMRGMDGSPSRVKETGMQSYIYEPGVYGEYMMIGEREILTRAAPMNPELPIPVADLISMRQRQIAGRLIDRIRYNIWTLLGTGTLSVPLAGPDGASTYVDTYAFQTYNATVPWASTASATPIKDFQNVQQLQVGHSVDLGMKAFAFMNQVTANYMLNNSNTADIGGRRDNFGATLNAMPQFLNYFAAQNLPKPSIVDDGFQPFILAGPITNSLTQFQKFIPNNKIIVIGARTNGEAIGKFKRTLQAMQMGVPTAGLSTGTYSFTKDYAQGINAEKTVPPRVEVHMGFNGGPTVSYPSSVVIMNV